jgi:hypothetical protein
MHTVHIILVEADSADEAYERVATQLSDSPLWSDWHNANGEPPYAGRWTGGVFLTEHDLKEIAKSAVNEATFEIAYKPSAPDILCYADDPELAEATLARFASDVKQEMRDCMPVGLDLDTLISEYSSYSADSTYPPMAVWQLKRVLDLLSGQWTPDSRFYDLESGCSTLAYFYERCGKEPHKQFLVPVDFHF